MAESNDSSLKLLVLYLDWLTLKTYPYITHECVLVTDKSPAIHSVDLSLGPNATTKSLTI